MAGGNPAPAQEKVRVPHRSVHSKVCCEIMKDSEVNVKLAKETSQGDFSCHTPTSLQLLHEVNLFLRTQLATFATSLSSIQEQFRCY